MDTTRGAEVLVGPPIKQMVYDLVTRSMLVYSEHVDKRLLVVREDGEVLARYSCHVQGLRPAPTQRNCFILHGPMVSYVVLDKPSERPVTVSNFEGKGFARLVTCAGDASFLATSAGQTQVLLTPQDDKLPQKWIEAHADCVTAMTATGVYEMPALFTGARDGRIRKWNPQRVEKPMCEVNAHSSMVTVMHLNATEKLLVTVSTDNTMRLWATETCEALATFRLNRNVQLVRDHLNVIYTTFDTGLILGWTVLKDFGAGDFPTVHKSYAGHHGAATDCCFAGAFMISCSTDSTVRIWHLDSTECVAVLRGHQSPVTACCVNLDSKVVFSSGQDGTLFRWDASAALSSGRGSGAAASFLEPVLERLRVTASLIASVVVQWLDPFLESSAERELGEGDPEEDPPEPLAEGSQEAEEEAIAMFRAALRSTVSDADLWQVYNCRSALHELHLMFSRSIVVLEKLPVASASPDALARAVRMQVEELLFALEQTHAANQQLCFAMAALFKRPKVRSLWERRAGSAVPHSLLRDTVTVVGEFLWSLLQPLAVLVKQAETNSPAKSDFAKALAMVVQTWSSMKRALQLSEEQVELLWADVGAVKVCQCELLQGGALGFLASLSSAVQTGCFAKCDFLDGDPSLACLLESVRLMPAPVFPDLHECGTTNEFIQAIKANGNAHPLSRLLAQFAAFASDCGYDVVGAVLGPLLSQSASLSEAALTAAPATLLLQLASSILPKPSARPMKQATFQLPKAASATRARIGHEHELCGFGSVCYSLQLFEAPDGISKLQHVLCPTGKHPAPLVASAPAPQARGPAEKIVRRASKILKRTFAALDKRKSLAIEKVSADAERDSRRTSAFDISATDYADSVVGEGAPEPKRLQGGRVSQRTSQRNSISRAVPSFSWNDLLSLVEDEEPPKQSPQPVASLAEFRPWDDTTTTSSASPLSRGSGRVNNARTSQVQLLSPSPPPEAGGREQDEELIGPEMQTFLGMDGTQSWRDVIQEEDDEDEELSAEFADLVRSAAPVAKKPLPQPRSSSTPPAKVSVSAKTTAQAAMTSSAEAIQSLGVAPKAPVRLTGSRTSGVAPVPVSPLPQPPKATWKKGGVSSDLVGSGSGSAVSSPVAPRKPVPRPEQRLSGDKPPPRRPLPEVAAVAGPTSPVSPTSHLKGTGLPSRLSSGFAKPTETNPLAAAAAAVAEARTPPTLRPPPPASPPTSRPPPRPSSQIK